MYSNNPFIISANIIMTILYITFFVYSMPALISEPYESIYVVCPSSNLWYYLLYANIFCLLDNMLCLSVLFHSESIYTKNIRIFAYIFQFVMVMWGFYEFFVIPCTPLLEYFEIYQLTYIFMVYNIIIYSLLILIMQCTLTFIIYSHYI